MKFLYGMIWLFPILFMIHDFEEIIMIEAWKKKNDKFIREKKIPYSFNVTTASFSTAVLFIFILFSAVTLFSYVYESYFLWLIMFLAFIFHLFFHAASCLVMIRYTPGVITSIPFAAIGIVLILKSKILEMYKAIPIIISVIILIGIAVGILAFLHRFMAQIDVLIKKYIEG